MLKGIPAGTRATLVLGLILVGLIMGWALAARLPMLAGGAAS